MGLYRILIFGLVLLASCTSNKVEKIFLLPMGDIGNEEINVLKTQLEEEYAVPVFVLPAEELPEQAFVNVKSARYRADSILKILDRRDWPKGVYIQAILNEDISTTKRGENGEIKQPEWKYSDWGIMGLAHRPGRVSVISTFRIRKEVSRDQYKSRLQKISTHEIGHNFGLPHCRNYGCVLQSAAEKVSTIDSLQRHLCGSCKEFVK